jgi:hypothetical protein
VSKKNGKKRVRLDPDAPGLDKVTRQRRRTLVKMQQMSAEQLLALAVRAGIYTKAGKLTRPYRPDAEPSATRPTD